MGANQKVVNEIHRYVRGPFPRVIVVNSDHAVNVRVSTRSIQIGCTTFSREVIENLLTEMKQREQQLLSEKALFGNDAS